MFFSPESLFLIPNSTCLKEPLSGKDSLASQGGAHSHSLMPSGKLWSQTLAQRKIVLKYK